MACCACSVDGFCTLSQENNMNTTASERGVGAERTMREAYDNPLLRTLASQAYQIQTATLIDTW
jgi:hypothetical protein